MQKSFLFFLVSSMCFLSTPKVFAEPLKVTGTWTCNGTPVAVSSEDIGDGQPRSFVFATYGVKAPCFYSGWNYSATLTRSDSHYFLLLGEHSDTSRENGPLVSVELDDLKDCESYSIKDEHNTITFAATLP